MRHLLLALTVMMGLAAYAQPNDVELVDPNPGDQSAWQNVKKTMLGWGNLYERYSRSQVPTPEKCVALHAWRGERVAAQALLWTPVELKKLTFKVSDLKSGKQTIPAGQVKKYFVRYTLTDVYEGRKDSLLMAERLDPANSLKVDARTTRPLWIDVKVPQDAKAGKYTGKLTAEFDGQELSIPLTLEVVDRVLPEPKDWKFHLDLWQNPYAVARYYQVPLWSKEHFDYMRPLMKQLANAGQKVITCSIIEHPWNCQTEDPFESMIVKMKELDGKWSYSYTVFDKWVEFMMECGITQQIDCYTLVPWTYQFEYYDVATASVKHVSCKPGEKAYEDYMMPFLKDFAKHLKAKGWFEHTCIAMDERPKEQLVAAFDIVKRADPNYRIAGAILNYFPEIAPKMYAISIPYEQPALSKEILATRKEAGQRVTFYTCCGPLRPNTFTFSPTAESAWIGWHAEALGYNGYLRWAYNSWVKQPNQDSRFRSWLSGDCFLVYPGGSSIRFERLTEGIQDYEKLQILKPELNEEQKAKLEQVMEKIRPVKFNVDGEAVMKEAKAVMKEIEKPSKK